MSPLDDELRSLLQSRAAGVEPAPDPLGGIESRARGLRRRRVLTSVSGAAAVVVAVAVAVPLLVSGSDTATRQPGGTSTPSPTVAAVTDGALFDPTNPWAPRGDVAKRVVTDQCTSCVALFTDVVAGRAETFSLEHKPDGTYVLAHDRYADATATIVRHEEQPLPTDLHSLAWALQPDDSQGRLVVVAAPDALVEYAGDGSSYQQISDVGQAPKGIGLVPIEAEAPTDTIRVTEAAGSVVVQPAPDWTPVDTTTPVNVLDTWVHRGDPQTISDATVVTAFDHSRSGSGGHYRSLYDGTRNGLHVTIGQAWDDGDAAAHTVAYDSSGTFFLGPETPRDPWVLGAVFASGGAQDLLVLLPRPGAGRIGYSPDGTSPFTDVASGRSDLTPVGLVDRDPKATADRVQVHRGDDSVILTEGIAKLTCGAKECG
ncbi:MAG: hypothetical protein JWL79_810 [Frankiales bacterium]|nr:hypothetical protein [Frankiales bacterium]